MMTTKYDKSIAILVFVTVLVCLMSIMSGAQADMRFVCVVHKGEWVWVRSQPDRNADKIESIRYGAEGEIHEIVNLYAHVTTDNGKEGWVDISYLEMPIKETTYRIITDGPVNRRETPDGRYMSKIKGGVNISVLGWRYSPKGELWAKVYKGGYVKATYLEQVID